MRRLRVGVIFGGQSGEHEVSLVSAQSVMENLDPEKYEVVPIGITRDGRWLIGGDPMAQLRAIAAREGRLLAPGSGGRGQTGAVQQSPETAANCREEAVGVRFSGVFLEGLDVVFPVLHGPYGEDGTIQGLLEIAGIPYVGAGVLASAVGMDKEIQKTVFRAKGLPVVDWLSCTRNRWLAAREEIIQMVEDRLGYPCFTKPACLGSSVGVSKCGNRDELVAGLDLAANYDRKLMVERAALNCREIEVSVLGNDDPMASLPGEVRPRREFYDYVAKYISDDTDLIIPADLPPPVTADLQRLAIAAFQAIDCTGMARVDFYVARDYSAIYIGEINTIPGFTSISMYPRLWQASGLSYRDLLDRLIGLALERHREKHG